MEEDEKEFSIFRKGHLIVIKNNKSINIKDDSLEISILDFSTYVNHEKDNLGKKIHDCLGIIGIITLEDETYLVTITKAKLICSISKKEIYKVLDTCFIQMTEDSNFELFTSEKEEDINKNDNDNENINDNYYMKNHDKEIIKELKEIFKNGFYFSNKYDLANSLTSYNQIMLFSEKVNY